MAAASLLDGGGLSNPNPTLFSPTQKSSDDVDPRVAEIFDLIRDIKDPEHPHTLEELNVVSEDCITVHSPCSTTSPQDRVDCTEPSTSQDSSSTGHTLSEPISTHTSSSAHSAIPPHTQEEDDEELWIKILFTPTVPHCSLATLIGLCLRVKLERCLEGRQFKLDIMVSEGAHTIEGDVNKQINDKERVAAAMENPNLREVVEECIREAEY